MTKEPWINLPVKDVKQSKKFFAALGFQINERFAPNDEMAGVIIGEKKINIMMVNEELFKQFIQYPMSDTKQGCEVLISFDAESREEVDAYAAKAVAAGGNLFAPPADNQGWMYGCAFADLDGHRWNVLYMDMSKMPQG